MAKFVVTLSGWILKPATVAPPARSLACAGAAVSPATWLGSAGRLGVPSIQELKPCMTVSSPLKMMEVLTMSLLRGLVPRPPRG